MNDYADLIGRLEAAANVLSDGDMLAPTLTEAAACIREMVEFNVNNTVWIKVTEHGRTVEADQWAGIGLTPPEPRVDSQGWEARQLWDVMSVFGHALGAGIPVPFETTIRLLPPAPGAEA